MSVLPTFYSDRLLMEIRWVVDRGVLVCVDVLVGAGWLYGAYKARRAT